MFPSAARLFLFTALLGTIVGTTLCSGAANAINQLMEIPFDCQVCTTVDVYAREGQEPFAANFSTR